MAGVLAGNTKVTRADWLRAAMDVLVRDGVERVKVLTLSEDMNVSRSSFYWYFGSRQDLLDALLAAWQAKNTAGLIGQADREAPTITAAVLNVWHCVVDTNLYDTALDFAVRDWARRSDAVRNALDASDATRLAALAAMFARYGYGQAEAEARARALYFMQLGYDLADPGETVEQRLAWVAEYLLIFTGRSPRSGEVDSFAAYARQFWTRQGDKA